VLAASPRASVISLWRGTEEFGQGSTFIATLSGLRENTAYEYRVVARSGTGILNEGEGRDVHHSDVAPKILGGTRASFVSASSAVMSGEVNPENSSTTYYFEYGEAEA
jgi:hypothetical protein